MQQHAKTKAAAEEEEKKFSADAEGLGKRN